MAEFKGLTVKFRGDTTDLTAALHTINSETSSARRNAQNFQRALKFNASDTNALRGAIGETAQQFLKASERADMLKQAIEAADDPNALRRLQASLAATEANVEQLHGKLLDMQGELAMQDTVLGRAAQGLQTAGTQMKTVGDKMSGVGDTLTTHVTAPLIAAAGVSIRSAVDIDTALTGVRKTVDGTEEQYQQLKDAAIELSKTQPISATQILDAEALGAQLGFGIDEIENFATVVNSLDVATNMNWEQAATNLAQFANITKMSHDDVERYGSTIVELGNNFATTESDVSDMAMRVAAAGTQVGMSEADILGLSTALTSMGINAEAGGTAISTIMSTIDKDIATGSENLKTWADTANMSVEDFTKAWSSEPVDALAAVLSGLEGATEEGGNMSVMLDDLGISSLRQTDVMKRLAGNSELVTKAVDTANKAWEDNSALSEEVDNRNDSLAAKFEILQNRVSAAASEVGEPLADALLDVVDLAEPLIDKVEGMARAFSNMSEDEQRAIIKNVAMVAAAGPMLSIFGRVTSAVGGVTTGLGKGLEAVVKFTAVTQNGGSLMEGFTSAMGLGADKAGALSTALKNMGTGLAIGGGIALVAATLKTIADEAAEAEQKTRNMSDATNLLRSATSDLSSHLGDAASGIDDMGQKAGDAWINIDNLAAAQADLAREFADSNKETETSVSRLEGAKQAIEEYAGKSGLSVQEQGKLKDAIQLVNDACGTQYEVVDAANGVIKAQGEEAEVTKDKLADLIEKQQEQIRVEALSDQLTKAYKQQADDIEAVANKTRYLKEAEETAAKKREELKESLDKGSISWGEYQAKMEGVDGYVQNAADDLGKAKDLLDASNDAIDNLNTQLGATEAAASGSATSIADLAGASTEVTSALADNQSIQDFATTLEEAGMKTDEFKSLTADQLIQLAANYDGTFESIAQTILDSDIGGKAGQKAAEVTGAIEGEAANTQAAAAEQSKAAATAGDFDVATNANANAKGLPDALRNQISPTETAANQLKTGAERMGDIQNQYQHGFTAASSLGSGIRGANGTVSSAAGSIRSSAESMKNVGDTYSSGAHLGSNFAAGIRSAIGAVSSAASAVASTARGILGHSIPKEGPLHEGGRGEVVYGEHLVMNFAQGMLNKQKEVESAARMVAQSARNGLTSVDDIYNPTISVVPSEIEAQTKALSALFGADGFSTDGKPRVEVTINGVAGPEETASALLKALALTGIS